VKSNLRSIVFLLVTIAACHRHASDAPESKASKAPSQSAATRAATGHNRRVFVTESSLPRDSYVVIDEDLQVGKSWYGSVEPMLEELAAQAQKKGADAVIEVKTWHRVSAWSWAAPQASGKAVRFKNPCAFDPKAFPGEYRPKSGGAEPVSADCEAAAPAPAREPPVRERPPCNSH